MNDKPTYRLLKEVLNFSTGFVIPIGELFEPQYGTNKFISKNGWQISKEVIENTDWFAKEEPPKPEIIKVMEFYHEAHMARGHEYVFTTTLPIPKSKFPELKKAIEFCFNNEATDIKIGDYTFKFQAVDTGKTYSQSEVDNIRQLAFYAGRCISDKKIGRTEYDDGDWTFVYLKKYKTFQDYINSLNQ